MVYKAYWMSDHNKTELVAVKTLKGAYPCTSTRMLRLVSFVHLLGLFTPNDVHKLVGEILKLHAFNHPNVMSLIGVCLDGSSGPAIIMPYMEKGSLLNHLKKERQNLVLAGDAKITEVMIFFVE